MTKEGDPMKKKTFLCLTAVLVLSVIVFSGCSKKSTITESEITEAQKTWGDGVVNIGAAYSSGGDYRKAAERHVDNFYAYQFGPVLFAPTKATHDQFRKTRDGAISYFVGGNDDYPEDKGFALTPWTDVRFENAGTYIHGDYAVAMGNYYFTPKDGEEVKVEYTFGYIKDSDGKLKINLHHSALPYPKK
jgi:hypothetical protein